ncbi:MAG: ABC transporter substrate-binding protein [Opitutales bacterium]
MQRLFIVLALILGGAAFATWKSLPHQQTELPVLHWVTDPHPARQEQIDGFMRWLEKNDYPPMELKLDAVNNEPSKNMIQGVSGVAGEIIDCYRAKRDLILFHNLGILEDVTEEAIRLGFSPASTYPSVEAVITIDGRQYGYPRNVATFLFWVNAQAFEDLRMEAPPAVWDFDTFERIGKEFVARANADEERGRTFFALPDQSNPMTFVTIMSRSLGLSAFNETMTASAVNDPRLVEVLERIYKWTFTDRLIPSAADRAAFTSAAGFGGASLHLFREGRLGMLMMGRYAVTQFRRFEEPIRFSISEPPAEEFRNSLVMGAIPTVYAGGKRKDLAVYFLAYLASEEYNRQIVRDGDGLPPNPIYTETEEFLRPPDYPNEWGVHEAFAAAAREIAIPLDHNSFILPATVLRIQMRAYELFLNHQIDSVEAARLMEGEINQEIDRVLIERADLRARHKKESARQVEIEARLARDEKVPLSWISNPFHRAYYQKKGWVDPSL